MCKKNKRNEMQKLNNIKIKDTNEATLEFIYIMRTLSLLISTSEFESEWPIDK